EVDLDSDPGVLAQAQIPSDLTEVDPDLESDLLLAIRDVALRVPLRAVGNREKKESGGSRIERQAPAEPDELEVPGIDLVRVAAAGADPRAARLNLRRRQKPVPKSDEVVGVQKVDEHRGSRTEHVRDNVLVIEAVRSAAISQLGHEACEHGHACRESAGAGGI